MHLDVGIRLFTGNNCISKKNLHPIKNIYKPFKIYIYNHFDGFTIVYTPIIGCIKIQLYIVVIFSSRITLYLF